MEVRDDLSDMSVVVPGLVAAICAQERLSELEFNSGELSGHVRFSRLFPKISSKLSEFDFQRGFIARTLH